MFDFDPIPVTPMEKIFTFKQKSEESFKEAWSRIFDLQEKTEPKMCLGLVIGSFYHGLALSYRYALDAVAGRDIFQCNENEALDAIKKLITNLELS